MMKKKPISIIKLCRNIPIMKKKKNLSINSSKIELLCKNKKYLIAADFLKRIIKADEEQQDGITIKNLIFNSNKCHFNKKEITALLCQTLRCIIRTIN